MVQQNSRSGSRWSQLQRAMTTKAARLFSRAGRAEKRAGLIENLEARVMLAGDHASFSQFPNVGVGDIVNINGTTGLGTLAGTIEPLGGAITEQNDLFRFTAPANDFVTIWADSNNAPTASSLDNRIRVYTRNAQNQPVLVGQANDSGLLTFGTPTDGWFGFVATQGTEYYVVVESQVPTGLTSTGAYTLRVDAISTNMLVNANTGVANLGRTITLRGSDEIFRVAAGSGSIFDSIATFNATATSANLNARLDTRLDIYNSSGVLIGSDSDAGRFNDAYTILRSSPSAAYYVRVRSDEYTAARNQFATGGYNIAIDLSAGLLPNPIDPILRRGFDTGGALATNVGFHAQIYTFRAEGSGRGIITAIGSGLAPLSDPALRLYKFDGTLLAFNNDLSGATPQIEFAMVGGQSYFVVVEGFNSAVPAESQFSLFIEAHHTYLPPSNIDDHPTVGTATATAREIENATPLIFSSPFLVTDFGGRVNQSLGWKMNAQGVGRIYNATDSDLFSFVAPVDQLGPYTGANDDPGTAVYAGGRFTTAGQLLQGQPLTANRIAAFDAGDWWPALDGLNGTVRTMLSWDEDGAPETPPTLYVGGDFTTATNVNDPNDPNGIITVNGIARLIFVNGDPTSPFIDRTVAHYEWRAMPGGGVTHSTPNAASVRALEIWAPPAQGTSSPDLSATPRLIVAGDFTTAGGGNRADIAQYLPGVGWLNFEAAPSATITNTGVINALEVYTQKATPFVSSNNQALATPTEQYMLGVGGSFGYIEYGPSRSYAADGTETIGNRAWRTPTGGPNGAVNSLAAFATPQRTITLTVNGQPQQVTTNESVVIAGGAFTSPGAGIAAYNGAAWKSFGAGLTGGAVNSVTVWDPPDPDGGSAGDGSFPDLPPQIVIGGAFTNQPGRITTISDYWANAYAPIIATTGFNNTVNTLAVISDTDVGIPTGLRDKPMLYAGGLFTNIDGTTANRVARLTFSNGAWFWQSLGTGAENGVNNEVLVIASHDDGNPNYWDRHDHPASGVNITITPEFGPFLNASIEIFDSTINVAADNPILVVNNIDFGPPNWLSLLNDSSAWPFDIGRAGSLDPSLILPGVDVTTVTLPVWGGETYYIRITDDTGSPGGRYRVSVTADAPNNAGPNATYIEPADDLDFANAAQFSQPVLTGDATNVSLFAFPTPPRLGNQARSYKTTQSENALINISELGNIDSLQETDIYTFVSQASGTAEARVMTANLQDVARNYINNTGTVLNKTYSSLLDSYIRVYNADFEQIAFNDDNAAVTNDPTRPINVGTFANGHYTHRDPRVVFDIVEGEKYYIVVGSGQLYNDAEPENPAARTVRDTREINWRHATGSYQLFLNGLEDLNPGDDDHGDTRPNESIIDIAADPRNPATNGKGSATGILNDSNDIDAFGFQVNARGPVTITVSRPNGSTLLADVNIISQDLQLIASGSVSPNGPYTATIAATPGAYFEIQIGSFIGATGAYTIDISSAPYADDYADWTQPQNAHTIDVKDFLGGGFVNGSIEQAGDDDVFRFSPFTWQDVTFRVRSNASTLNPYLTVYEVTLDGRNHPVFVRIGAQDDIDPDDPNNPNDPFNLDSEVTVSMTPNRLSTVTGLEYKWYYVRVEGSDGVLNYGDYTLEVEFDPTDDYADSGEYDFAGNIPMDPNTGVGQTTGVTEFLSDSDLFRFIAPAGGDAAITVSRPLNSNIIPKVTVFTYDNGIATQIATGTASVGPLGFLPAESGLFTVIRNAVYYVLVENTGGLSGSYNVSVNAPAVDDYPNIGEFDIAHAIPLSNSTGNGQIGDGITNPTLSPVNDSDLFKFTPFYSGAVKITLSSIFSNSLGGFAPRLRVFDASGTLLAGGDVSNATAAVDGTPSTLEFTFAGGVANTTYYVLVSAVDGLAPPATVTGEFTLKVDSQNAPDGSGGNPGDIDFDEAVAITLDPRTGYGETSDLINVAGDRDLFTFIAPPGLSGPAFVQVVTPTGSVLDAGVVILDDADEAAEVVENNSGIPGVTASAQFTQQAGRQYYAVVAGIGNGVGAYTIRVKMQPQRQFLYFPEGYASPAIREFISISNNNSYTVKYSLTAYYEVVKDAQGNDVQHPPTTIVSFGSNQGTISAGARSGATSSAGSADYDADPNNDSEGKRANIIPGVPYALVIESDGPLGGTLAHYDFGATLGDSFTEDVSATWTFARVERNPGSVEDYLLYFNPNNFPVIVSATAYTTINGSVVTTALPQREVGANRRGGLAIDQIPNVPVGVSSVVVTARAKNSTDDSAFRGIVASLSHYNKASQSGFAFIADAEGGSTNSAVTSLTNGTTVTGELVVFNPGTATANVTITSKYVISNLPDNIRSVNIPAKSTVVLRGNGLGLAANQPVGVVVKSNQKVSVTSAQEQFGEADATRATSEVGTAYFFGDGFMNTALAGSLYFETLSFYNPSAVATIVNVKLLFTGINDFINVPVAVSARGFAQLELHKLPALIEGRPGLNFYSIQASSVSPFAAALNHYDLFLRGGYTTGGIPLGLSNPLSGIPS